MLRLTRSLEGDASETLAVLGWQPRVSFEAALDDLVAGYRA
jgi:nucleoside-diphosphate-sugar epimerase